MLYVLDHYYAYNHVDFCLVVESDKKVKEVVEITAAIAFLLEELTEVSVSLDNECLLEILETYYGMKNVKGNILENSMEELALNLPIDDVYVDFILTTEDTEKKKGLSVLEIGPGEFYVTQKVYIIDLYEARESCCGNRYTEVMGKWLPEGGKLEELKELLKEKGVEK